MLLDPGAGRHIQLHACQAQPVPAEVSTEQRIGRRVRAGDRATVRGKQLAAGGKPLLYGASESATC